MIIFWLPLLDYKLFNGKGIIWVYSALSSAAGLMSQLLVINKYSLSECVRRSENFLKTDCEGFTSSPSMGTCGKMYPRINKLWENLFVCGFNTCFEVFKNEQLQWGAVENGWGDSSRIRSEAGIWAELVNFYQDAVAKWQDTSVPKKLVSVNWFPATCHVPKESQVVLSMQFPEGLSRNRERGTGGHFGSQLSLKVHLSVSLPVSWEWWQNSLMGIWFLEMETE